MPSKALGHRATGALKFSLFLQFPVLQLSLAMGNTRAARGCLLFTMGRTRLDNQLLIFGAVSLALLGITVTTEVAEWKAIENPCLCQQFRCESDGICLHAQRVCDGNKDCPGGEDERNNFTINGKCYRKKMKCNSEEFPCKFGDCIKLTQVCDGIIDCWGAVDESSDFCTWVHSNQTER